MKQAKETTQERQEELVSHPTNSEDPFFDDSLNYQKTYSILKSITISDIEKTIQDSFLKKYDLKVEIDIQEIKENITFPGLSSSALVKIEIS